MKPILYSLLVATLPFGSVLADAPKENAKVTLVYQHELPNVPGKSIKGVLAADAARMRRRGDRITEINPLGMSLPGTFETCRLRRAMSEFEGKAENMCSY